jgi:hypothetical protein
MNVSNNSDIRAIVSQTIKQYPWVKLEQGSRHRRLRCERTQDFILIPSTPSDFRASKNLRSQVRRLIEHGEGLIAAKQRH